MLFWHIKDVLLISDLHFHIEKLAVSLLLLFQGKMYLPLVLRFSFFFFLILCSFTIMSPGFFIQVYLLLLYFALSFADTALFYKLNVCGNPAFSNSMGTIFPKAFAYCVSLCHILMSNIFIIVIFLIVISDWCSLRLLFSLCWDSMNCTHIRG